MIISALKAAQLIKNPANSASIIDAREHEERIKLHTKPVNDRKHASPAFDLFLKWVREDIRLPEDKMNVFEGMCIFPLPTTSLCTSIKDEYKKIFTASDSYREYSLLESTFKSEFKDYIENTVKVKTYFEHKGLDDFMKHLNCVYVVDMPAEQVNPIPDPYFYKVNIRSITDISVSKSIDSTHKIDYLIYKRGERWIVIDDLSYKVFIRREQKDATVVLPENPDAADEYIMLFESFHNLGYTPACFLSINDLYDDDDGNLIAKKNTLSDAAGDLDWLLFWKVAERMYEAYGPFPIMTIPDTNCSFMDFDGNYCQNGVVISKSNHFAFKQYDCPICKKNSNIGPGTVWKQTSRTLPDQQKPDAAAVTITPPDIPSLDYITKKTDYLEWNIYENAVGQSDKQATKEAINEKQVQKEVEGKRNVLLDVKKNIEHAEQFIVDTIGRLRYGGYYEGSTIKMGEQLLIQTADDVIVQFMEYKKAGLPSYMIAQKKNLLIQTEFKNNSYEKQRAELLDLLEPWPNYSVNECLNFKLNISYPELFFLKMDFAKFVSKFELANGDIVQWGSKISLESKIDKLTQILFKNVKAEYESRRSIETSGESKVAS